MNKLTLLWIFLLFLNTCHSQYTKTRIPVGLFNKDSTKIIGISTGFASFGYVDNKTIGLHLEVFGLGEMVVHPINHDPISDSARIDELRNYLSPKRIYGINISGMGLICRSCDLHGLSINGFASLTTRVHGLQVSGIASIAEMLNGVQLSILANGSDVMNGIQISGLNIANITSKGMQIGIYNRSKDHTGIQIGIINKTVKLKGVQLGIWNISGKRKLPLINW